MASFGLASVAGAQLPRVGIIDLFGLRKTKPEVVREALGIAVGDSLTSLSLLQVPAQLADLPGVASASVDPVCCEEGKTMLYVGLLEDGAPKLELRLPPNGKARLTPDVIQVGVAVEQATMRAVMSGFVKEDISQGHSLLADSTTRMLQMRYIDLAAKYRDTLRAVLRTADDGNHRALAAEVIAYAPDKASIVPDLVLAMRDPSSEVRNTATRALALIAGYAQAHPQFKIEVPYEPFIDLMSSLSWTDRNKASLALMQLTEGRDPKLLAALKARAFDSLVEMAQWTNPGHSMAGVVILGRMAGMPDAEIFSAFEKGEKERVIAGAKK